MFSAKLPASSDKEVVEDSFQFKEGQYKERIERIKIMSKYAECLPNNS